MPLFSIAVILTTLATGFDHPVQVVANDGQLFVAEQKGRIVRTDGVTLLDISDVVGCCDNGGLLSFAFHNGRIFVLYVNHDGDTVVAEYGPTPKILMTIDQPAADVPNHHGGTLRFGSDGYLYISIGDGGVKTGVSNRAQDLTLRLGKLLRIDVDHGSPYAIPPDNPFVQTPGAVPEIWALGLRNPWRFTIDGGELILGDVGEDTWEELNVVSLAQSRGANFGWPIMEASHCFPSGASCNTAGLTMPVLEYSHGEGCSITAGLRYRGARIPELTGKILYGDWCAGTIWADGTPIAHTTHAIVSFGEDENHEPLIVDYLGGIYRLEPPAPPHRRAVRH